MHNIKTFFTSKYILWLILAIPGTLLTVNYYRDQVNYDIWIVDENVLSW